MVGKSLGGIPWKTSLVIHHAPGVHFKQEIPDTRFQDDCDYLSCCGESVAVTVRFQTVLQHRVSIRIKLRSMVYLTFANLILISVNSYKKLNLDCFPT